MPFNVVEPHPSVPKTAKKAHLSTGRGGAGNFSRHAAETLTSGPEATGPASRLSTSNKEPTAPTTMKSKYTSRGIGGAGNFVPASERRLFSFDEELERQQRLEAARESTPVYHFGRGGAGNLTSTKKERTSSSSSQASGSSAASVASSEAAANRAGSRFSKVVRALSNTRE